MGEGTHEMMEMAEIIRSGAADFLKTEYKTIINRGIAGGCRVYALYRKDQRHNLRDGQPDELRRCAYWACSSATYANVRTANKLAGVPSQSAKR